MNLHLLELFRSQPAGFVDDVIGHSQLADVVQKSRGSKSIRGLLCSGRVPLQFRGHTCARDAVLMGRMIFGVDGQSQAFDRAQMERANLFDMVFFGCYLQLFDATRFFWSSRRAR